MKSDAVRRFAEEWIEAWNRRDFEAVLEHMRDDVQFTSPRAVAVCGRSTMDGKDALRAYWAGAMASITSLRFRLDYAVGGDGERMVIVYMAEINGVGRRAAELFEFDSDGRVVRGEAMYGAELGAG